jgi:hypothetical protein
MYKGSEINDSNNIHTQLYPHANSYPPLISIDLPSSFGADIPFNNQGSFAGGMYPSPVPSVQSGPIVQPVQSGPSVQPVQSGPSVQPVQSGPSVQPVQSGPSVQPVTTFKQPPNGCLKGGSKPTFRQYHNKTLKRPHVQHSVNNSNNMKPSLHIKNRHKSRHNAKIRQKTRRTKVSTFKLGKRGNKVSVLIKNNVTRRKVKREHGILKQKNLSEIKKYLYDRNFLRIGSTAPPDVLRTLYEQSVLAGDITNVGMNATLQNFLETI